MRLILKTNICFWMIFGVAALSSAASPTTARKIQTTETYRHEVLLNGNNQILPITAGTNGALAIGNGTIFSLGGAYNFSMVEAPSFVLQLGVSPTLLVVDTSSTNSTTLFSMVMGPTFNWAFDGDIQNAAFAAFQLGFIAASGNTGFAFRFEAGKRFRMFDHLAFHPSLGVLHLNSSTFFLMNLLGASVHF